MKTATLLAMAATIASAADIRMVGTNCYDITSHPTNCMVSGIICEVTPSNIVVFTNYDTVLYRPRARRELIYGTQADRMFWDKQMAVEMQCPVGFPKIADDLGMRVEFFETNICSTSTVFNCTGTIGDRVTLFAIPSGKGKFDFGIRHDSIPATVDFYQIASKEGLSPTLPTQHRLRRLADTKEQRLITWQHQQASNGVDYIQHDLGLRYLAGNGVPQDTQLALQWIRAAATNQFQPAIQFLATNTLPPSPLPQP